jgi:hypothetical protein
MAQKRTVMCAVVGLLLATVPFALASVSDPGVSIVATNGNGTATLSIPMSSFTYDPFYGEWDYIQSGQVDLYTSPGHLYVARVKALSAFLIDDPTIGASIILQYSLVAGATQTNFTVNSGVVSFGAIPAALAAASMSDTFVLSDINGNGNANLAALNNYAYKTYYGEAAGPTEFFFHGSDSVGSFGGTIPGGIYNAYDNWPAIPGEYENLGVSVDRIRTTTAFSVTAMDESQVQSTFGLNFIPEPATVGLVSVGGLLLLRRRR